MASTNELNLESGNVQTAAGITLDDKQRTLVGSVLDLFAGKPSLKKLQLWADDAVFEDNITKAEGRKQYEPQWYGLQTAFSQIDRLHHQVTAAGNPIEMDMKTRYVVKGIGKEQVIESKILIAHDPATGKITRVEDRWGGHIPDNAFTTAMRKLNAVSVPKMVSVPKNNEQDAARGNQ